MKWFERFRAARGARHQLRWALEYLQACYRAGPPLPPVPGRSVRAQVVALWTLFAVKP